MAIHLNILPASGSINFGNVLDGQSQTQNITLTALNTNTGVAIGTISGSASPFSVSPSSFNLEPGETQVIVVTFAPVTVASFSDTLTISGNGDFSGAHINLSGNGIAATYYTSVDPASRNFGSVAIGLTKVQIFTFTADAGNSGSMNVTIDVSGIAAPFSITAGTTATIDGVVTSNTVGFGGTLHIKLLKDPTLGWLVIGNGQVANMGVNTRAQLDYWSTVTNPQSGSNMLNGLHVYINAFDYNANHSNAMITDAVVTGPGLPTAGINMHQDTKNTWFDVTAYGSFDLIPECGTLAYSSTGNIAHTTGQCIDIAKTVDNGVYTVLLKTANGTVVNGTGDTLQISKKPYAISELTNAMFPSITSSTINGQPLSLSGLSNVAANQSLAVIWTMPSGLTVNDVNMWSSVSSGANFVSAMKHLGNSTVTQTLLGLGTPSTTGPVTNVGVWVGVHDIYGRTFATSKAISQ